MTECLLSLKPSALENRVSDQWPSCLRFCHVSFLTSAKPYWEEEPKDVETSVGASTTFICKAKGYPEPKIAWFVNGIKLEGKVNWFFVICDADHLVVSAPFVVV